MKCIRRINLFTVLAALILIMNTASGQSETTDVHDEKNETRRVLENVLPAPFESLEILYGHTSNVMSVRFSPDGTTLASGSRYDTIKIFSVHGGGATIQTLGEQPGDVNSVEFTSDGTKIVAGNNDGAIKVWDVHNGGTIVQIKDKVRAVNFSPNAKYIVSRSADGTIHIWDVEHGEALNQTLTGHTGSVSSLTFSPDGNRLASGSDDDTIKI